jgi:aconitate hydratase
MKNSFDARQNLTVNGNKYEIFSLKALASRFPVDKLPYSLKILLENLLRHEDGENVSAGDIEALANWNAQEKPSNEIAFTPSRVILQDFTGVPAIVDLAAMRDAVVKLGGKADSINPLSPAELVIDHSVQVDVYGAPNAFMRNA